MRQEAPTGAFFIDMTIKTRFIKVAKGEQAMLYDDELTRQTVRLIREHCGYKDGVVGTPFVNALDNAKVLVGEALTADTKGS